MASIYKISDQGFGVHTFEIKIVHLNKDDYHTIRDRIKDISKKDEEKKCYIVKTARNSGLRIMLYWNIGKPPYLSVIVNPCQLLNDTDPCHILTTFDNEQLRSLLDETIQHYLGNEFGLSRFKLTRVDCTVDFIMDNCELSGNYIQLVSRSIRLFGSSETYGFYKNTEYDEDCEKRDLNIKRCFRVTNRHFYSFTVYDKLYDLIRNGYCEDKLYQHGILRFELAQMDKRINEVSSVLNTSDIFELLSYFTRNSEIIMRKFFSNKIISGDYYKYFCAKHIIAPDDKESKTAYRVLKLLIMSEKSTTLNELMFKFESEIKSVAKKRTVSDFLKKLNISPVTIPDNTFYKNDNLPGIHTMFGIERKGGRVQ